MSDLEEMDSDRLNELESILYSSIHYNDYNDGTAAESVHPQQVEVDMDARYMPPPLQRQQRIVSDKRVINNGTGKPRYWTDNKCETSTPVTNPEEQQPRKVVAMEQTSSNTDETKAPEAVKPKSCPKKSAPLQKKPKMMPQQQRKIPPAAVKKPQDVSKQELPTPKSPTTPAAATSSTDFEPERFDQRLLVAIPSNWPIAKPKVAGGFAKEQRKLEQHQRLDKKRQKSKRAKQQKKMPVEIIDLMNSESSDTDDVILVPAPPVPIINVDASDEEPDEEQQDPDLSETEPESSFYEENAMDAADIALPPTELPSTPTLMHSPCNSVLSSDDFIVQKDTSRLLAECASATDEDLLVLTQDAMRDAAVAEQLDKLDNSATGDNSSEYEFVPPSRLEEIKRNYRVDEQQFRALDVYESESDLTESGIYSKGKPKATPTIIRSVDSPSDSSDVEEAVDATVNKTKRLRKRRASSTNQSQSDARTEGEELETDTDEDEAQATGVPGIARGMAVERCKRKIRRLSQRQNAEEPHKLEPMQESSDSGDEEEDEEQRALPTARQIAERLLEQQQQQQEREKKLPKLSEIVDIISDDEPMVKEEELRPQLLEDVSDTNSVGSDANTEDEAELQSVMNREHLSDVFKRIDEHAADAKRKQQHPELEREPVSSSEMEERSVEIVDEELELAKLTELDEDKQDEEMEPQHPVDVLMAPTMRALQDQPRGGDLVGWNMEMCRFYNDSWHGEHFSLNKLYKGMSGHRNDWRIMNSDRYPVARKRSNFKCTNCLEMGHVRVKCPRPRKPIVCYTCGNTGHAEPRCPNAICLGCGSKQALYVQKCNKCSFHSRVVCQICKMRGHTTELCPDKWRRYHSTTRSNVQLESNVQYRTKHCSYCAARGHLFEECRQRMGEFRQQVYTSQIISHQKTYKDRTGRLSYLEDTPALFPIETPFHFNWDSEFASNSCYARFLKVVGLAKPPEKIRRLKAPPQQVYTNDYVPNPQAKAASSKQQIQLKEITSNTQTKANVSKINTHELDSDSNYSFSEHFELPSSTTTSNEEQPTSSAMPDMIPLSTTPEPEEQLPSTSQQQQQPQRIQGISMCVNTKLNAVPEAASNTSTGLGDLPTEARILMARDQTEYLFSPEGREFLTDSAKQCQVSVRMDFKEYGYVLVIYGVKKQQEQLQLLLMHRHQQVKNKTKEFTSQLPPKRVDVLIRFIRDGIASLQKASLGKPHDHYQRIKQLEQQNTKHSYKLAASKRRLLNMILLGQAGLGNGTMHLDKLLLILGKLIEEYPAVEVATPALRQEIDDHWRVIFTAYPHENYDELLFDYVMLKNKNRLTQLMIDPKLMGIQPRKPAAVLLTPYQPQQQQQQQQQQPQQQRSPKQRGKPTTLPHACEDQDQEQAPAAPSMRPPKQKPPKTKPRQVVPVINTRRQLPVNDPHQRSPSNLRLEKHLRPECVRLLADMENGTQDSHKINTDATKPSMFWSRESLQYLDDLFKLTDNAATIERLQRVLERSRRGQLSHNDYRAVIKLHSVMAHN